jgi:hypothetical protein
MKQNNFSDDLTENQIQNEDQNELIKSRCVKLMLKFDKTAKERLFVLDENIFQDRWIDTSICGFEVKMAAAHMDLQESYVRFFEVATVYNKAITLVKHLYLNTPHPLQYQFTRMRDWCSMIPVLSSGVVQRLNICVNFITRISQYKVNIFRNKEEKEFIASYVSEGITRRFLMLFRQAIMPVRMGSG